MCNDKIVASECAEESSSHTGIVRLTSTVDPDLMGEHAYVMRLGIKLGTGPAPTARGNGLRNYHGCCRLLCRGKGSLIPCTETNP